MNITQLDLYLLKLIGELSSPFLDHAMKFVSSLGNGGFMWILLALILICFKKTRAAGAALSAALIFCLAGGNILLKPLIARVRPFNFDTSIIPLIPPPEDFSFPSGHTLSSFASAAALLRCDRRLGIPALIFAALMAFSRLYLMVHYPSDVLGGMALGIAFGIAAEKITKKYFFKPKL